MLPVNDLAGADAHGDFVEIARVGSRIRRQHYQVRVHSFRHLPAVRDFCGTKF